jgi:hypothetical protein
MFKNNYRPSLGNKYIFACHRNIYLFNNENADYSATVEAGYSLAQKRYSYLLPPHPKKTFFSIL